MQFLDKHSNFIDHRKSLRYPDGSIVQIGDIVDYDGKTGTVVNFDRQTVNIKLDDGTEQSHTTISSLRKIASDIACNVVKDSYWIKR